MVVRSKLEDMFKAHGYVDFRWLEPEEIEVAHWVRMKCMFGCSEYGRTATCPPNVPSVDECRDFFQNYEQAVVFHLQKAVEKPEDRFVWTREMNLSLLEVERKVFISGYKKAFLLFLDSCNICDSCPGKKDKCKEPRQARPTPEAMAVDVFATVQKLGYPIEVLSDYSQVMNRYAFLLIE